MKSLVRKRSTSASDQKMNDRAFWIKPFVEEGKPWKETASTAFHSCIFSLKPWKGTASTAFHSCIFSLKPLVYTRCDISGEIVSTSVSHAVGSGSMLAWGRLLEIFLCTPPPPPPRPKKYNPPAGSLLPILI